MLGKRWEYLVVMREDLREDILPGLGEEGWEAVCMIPVRTKDTSVAPAEAPDYYPQCLLFKRLIIDV